MSDDEKFLYDTSHLFSDLWTQFSSQTNTWKIKQNDGLDAKTSFIYATKSLQELRSRGASAGLTADEVSYAEHRWRNFRRHDAWLALIIEFWPSAIRSADIRNKKKDFSVIIDEESIDFDLKVTRFPSSLSRSIDDLSLARWMYENQSTQGRFHLSNRLFVVATEEVSLYQYALAKESILEAGISLAEKLLPVAIAKSKEIPTAIVIRV